MFQFTKKIRRAIAKNSLCSFGANDRSVLIYPAVFVYLTANTHRRNEENAGKFSLKNGPVIGGYYYYILLLPTEAQRSGLLRNKRSP